MSNPLYYVGFLDPAYTTTFTDSATGNTLNLTGATGFTMFMVDRGTLQAKQCTGQWTTADQIAHPGQASYQWTARDMDTAGTWLLYRSVQLTSEPNPREFDPDTITVTFSTKGGISVSTQDVNIAQVLGNPVSSTNGVPSDVTDRQARLLGLTGMQGTPDAGTTYKTVKTASDGTLAVNSNLQAGVNLGGAMMTYREMVSRALVGNIKFLTGTQALVNNGGGAAVLIPLTDQNGNADAAVPNGKTRYIAYVDATLDMGGTNTAPLVQTATITISDGTNNKVRFVASSGGPGRDLPMFPTIASNLTLTVKASPSNLGTAVGNVVVTVAVWDE